MPPTVAMVWENLKKELREASSLHSRENIIWKMTGFCDAINAMTEDTLRPIDSTHFLVEFVPLAQQVLDEVRATVTRGPN